jgi:epoxyqueuosine reductase
MDHDLSLTARLRAEARRLGFFKMGVAAAGPLPWKQHFDAWLAEGMHGDMSYLERQADKRKEPALVLDNVRSILVLAVNYHVAVASSEDPLRGKISRYARGEDYHRLIQDRLRALLDFIRREEPRAHGLFHVDTGPVMEKVWGAHSSLGWMGKHSNLITRQKGSWFFTGVILLDLELEYDAREKDYCGACSRCIDACPTGAIVAPYVVDARLCISYLTIELKGAIPRRLRTLIGNRIFGCDDCQEACPWNRFAVSTAEQKFWPRDGNLAPELTHLAATTREEFDARFKNSPVRRARRDGFVRNVVTALGNSRRSEAVPALAQAMGDASSLVRTHAAWALGRIGTLQARAALVQARRIESDPEVLEEIELALDLIRPR